MPTVFDPQGNFLFAVEIMTHHGTQLQCNHPTYAWISVSRAEAGDWERIWLMPTLVTETHQGVYFFSHFSNYLKLSGYTDPNPVFDSTATASTSGAVTVFMDPIPERGNNWFALRYWNSTLGASRYFKALPSTADTPIVDSNAVGDWEGFQVRVLPVTVRANTAAVMRATSATTLGTYTGSVTATERFDVEQCLKVRTNVYLKSKYYGSYVSYVDGYVVLADKTASSALVVEKKSGTTTGQVTLRFLHENKYLSAPSTGGLIVATSAGTDETFDIIYA